MSDDIATSDQTALVVIPAEQLPTIIAADKDDILGKLSRRVAAFRPDVSTARGRAEMRSLAAEIASAKMDLIRIGKGLTETWRKSTKAVNEECNIIEERMNALRDRVRERLTEYENREKVRVAGHEDALARRLALTAFEMMDPPSELIRERLKEAEAPHIRDWEEFRERASDQRAGIIDNLTSMLAAAVKREAEAAELARLRAAEEERQRQEAERIKAEREAKIAAEAAEAAKREAERIAAEQAAEAERRAQAERDRIEAEAAAAAQKAEQERLAIEQREREANERAARLEREHEEARIAAHTLALASLKSIIADAISPMNNSGLIAHITGVMDQMPETTRDFEEFAQEAETVIAKGRQQIAARLKEVQEQEEVRRKKAEAEQTEKAERDKAAAVEQEKARAHAEKKAEEAAQKAREANKAHKAKINREALAALILCGLTEQQGVAVVTAIAKGEVPHCKMEY